MLTGLLVVWIACTAAVQSSPTAANTPPATLLQLGGSAAALFVTAQTGEWKQAAAQVADIQRSLDDIPASIGPGDVRAQLHRRVSALRRSVARRQAVLVMRSANDVTRLAAELEGSFGTAVPFELKLLDYYGRQIQIGIAARRLSIVQQATRDIRQRWNALRPRVERLGRTDDARRFTDIVVGLERARQLADAAPLAVAELNAVDQLERAFGG
ncbi:MAG: hypothetical protein ACRD2I_18760 [Vicinamibacterales bacterium]